jgi:hypothetical protein
MADSMVILETDGAIYSYNALVGTKVWQSIGKGRMGGTFVNNTIYYGSLNNSIYDSVRLNAYDFRAKSLKWSFIMQGGRFLGKPCVVTKSGKMYRIGDN